MIRPIEPDHLLMLTMSCRKHTHHIRSIDTGLSTGLTFGQVEPKDADVHQLMFVNFVDIYLTEDRYYLHYPGEHTLVELIPTPSASIQAYAALEYYAEVCYAMKKYYDASE